MQQASLPAALTYDDSLLATLTIVDPESGQSFTVRSIPAGLFGHLCREAVRTLPDAAYCLRIVRDYDFAYVSDKCHCLRWLLAGGRCRLDWLPRLAETA